MSNRSKVFLTPEAEKEYLAAYESVFENWPVPYDLLRVKTEFGITHINVCGPRKAPPLFLLPDYSTSSVVWYTIIAALSEEYRVFAIDTMGDVGRSIPERVPENRTEYVNWLAGVIDVVGMGSVDLIGFSFGGYLCVCFALTYPARVDRLVLLNPRIRLVERNLLGALRGLPERLTGSRWNPNRFRHVMQGANDQGVQEDILREPYLFALKRRISTKLLQPDMGEEEIIGLKPSTLLLIGENEQMYQPSSVADQARQLIPNVNAQIVPKAGHILHYDQPDEVISRTLGFLGPMGEDLPT